MAKEGQDERDWNLIKMNIQRLKQFQQQLCPMISEVSKVIQTSKKNQTAISSQVSQLKKIVLSESALTNLESELTEANEVLRKTQEQLDRMVESPPAPNRTLLKGDFPEPATSERKQAPLRTAEDLYQKTQITTRQSQNKPYFLMYKSCVLKSCVQIYNDGTCKVIFKKTPQGIQLTVYSKDPNFKISKLNDRKIQTGNVVEIDWSQFENQKYVLQCVLNSPHNQLVLPIPLPANILFQPRFKRIPHSRASLIKQHLPKCHQIVIRHYDRNVVSAVSQYPETLGMQNVRGQLMGVFNMRGSRHLYLCEGRVAEDGFHITVRFKCEQYLRHLLQFYSFIFSE